MFPSESDLTICFAHVAYQLQQLLASVASCRSGTRRHLARPARCLGSARADVLVISGLWRNELAALAPKAALHSVGRCRHRSVRPVHCSRSAASASPARRGVNVNAVSEHVMSLILALARRLPEARDNQAKHVWRSMLFGPDAARGRARRQDAPRPGPGGIGGRLARLAKAFDMLCDRGPSATCRKAPRGADSAHTLGQIEDACCRRPTSWR